MAPVTLLRSSDSIIEKEMLAEIVISQLQGTCLPEIMLRWPNTKEAIIRLCNYLTDSIPSTSGSGMLLDKCVEQALLEWKTRAGEAFSDKDRANAFLRGLLQPLPEVLSWRVEWPERERKPLSVWNPYEEPLSTKWNHEGCAPVVKKLQCKHKPDWTKVADADFRAVLLTKFIMPAPHMIRGKVPEFDFILGRSES